MPIEEVNRAVDASAHADNVAAANPSLRQTAAPRAADDPYVHVDGLDREAASKPDTFSSSRVEQDAGARAPSPLDVIPWIASIPRCCDTCRDYRREPDGDGGYCGNADAFPNQTVVKSHELACRSSFGVFWLPSDEIWLEQAEISHHTRPTPYLDEVLAEVGPGS